MAKTVTLGSLRLQAQQRADQENSNFLSTSEWNSNINASAAELYDLLVTLYEDYYATSQTIAVTGSTDTYSLPADFYKLLGVDIVLSATSAVTLKPFIFNERNSFAYSPTLSTVGANSMRYQIMGQNIRFIPYPTGTQSIKLWYVPAISTLTLDADTLDGVNGYEEYVVVDAAIKAMQKEESDVSVLMAQKQALIKRIQDSAVSRDAAYPKKVSDTSRVLPYEMFLFGENT